MTQIYFTVPVTPVAKARARAYRSGSKGVRFYTPQKTVTFEQHVQLLAKQAMAGKPPTKGMVVADIHCYMAMPQSWPKKKRIDVITSGWHTQKPDWDNLGKAASDACNGIVYVDDCQIAEARVRKSWTSQREGQLSVTFTFED